MTDGVSLVSALRRRQEDTDQNTVHTCPGCWPGMAARTLMVVPRVPKVGGGMLAANGGRVKTTLAWGWGPVWEGGGGAVGVVVGVLGPVVVVEELGVEL